MRHLWNHSHADFPSDCGRAVIDSSTDNNIIVRPHHYAQYKMRPIATDVAWSVCLFFCLLVTFVSRAKTDKRIEMPFGMRTRVSLRNHVLKWAWIHWISR